MTILLLHSMYGRRPAVLDAAGRLRATGHEVVVPDLYDGRTTGDVDEGVRIKDEIGWAELRRRAAAAAAPHIGDRLVYAGFSLGAGLAQELAFEDGGAAGLLLMHGVMDIGGKAAGLRVQLHIADPDPFDPPEAVEEWHAGMRGAGAEAEVFRYPGGGYLFTDPGLPDHDATAAEAAWERATAFLRGL
jgi:dienelactone hydrolase